MDSTADQSSPWLRRLAFATALATLGLIAIGGLVTSKGAGMAVPDWPTTYGYNMFFFPISQWTGGIFYEHSHRLWASLVGLLTAVTTGWIWARESRGTARGIGLGGIVLTLGLMGVRTQPMFVALACVALGVVVYSIARAMKAERPPRWWAMAAFAAVLVQGVLGGLRVTALKDELGIVHGTFAQLFLVLVWAIALAQTQWWNFITQSGGAAGLARFRSVFLALALLVLAQLILGASMRHQHAGLAIPDFPFAHGKLWPATDAASLDAYNRARRDVIEAHPITAAHIHLHMTHRVTAVLLLGAAVWLVVRTRRALGGGHPVSRFALAWCGLVVAQASLGVFTVLSNKAADIATLHVVLGALTLLSMALAAVLATRACALQVFASSSDPAVLPHPGPLPLGEGEAASASRNVEACALAGDGIGDSLSQWERAGVRENASPADTAGRGNQAHESAGH